MTLPPSLLAALSPEVRAKMPRRNSQPEFEQQAALALLYQPKD